MPVRAWKLLEISLLALVACCLLSAGCAERAKPKVEDDRSQLKQATDVFWALQKLGYITAKQKPQAGRHGCKPAEYLARKGEALFRISVFECETTDKAREVVEHPKSRHVDSLLRNHHEGGILRRNAMEVIIRRTQGTEADAEALLEALGGL